jgi:RNA polymerase sigma factor (sigma-70 family)
MKLCIIPGTSDRECLESLARHRDADSLRTLVERYLVFVYSSALRRTGDAAQAAEVTRAVFLVLARRARRLRKKTVLAGWLFHVATVACRKLRQKGMGRLRRLWQWISRKPRPLEHRKLMEVCGATGVDTSPLAPLPDRGGEGNQTALPPDATLWTRLAPQIDHALERLRTKQRNAVLLCAFLNHDSASAARILRSSVRRVENRVGRGMKKLAKQLRKRHAPVDPGVLASACATESCAAAVPEVLGFDILQSMAASGGKRPSLKLAHRTLNTLAWLRWRRRLVIGYLALNILIAIPVGITVYLDSFSGYSRLRSEAILRSMHFLGWWQLTATARPWPANAATPRLDASILRNAADLYRTTNIWHVHLRFTPEQWKALEFKRIGPMPNFDRPEGLWFLRNPQARRSGIAGVLGFEFDWTHAGFEFGGVAFTNVAARVKGNILSLSEPTRSYKVDLNKFAPGQKLAGLDELTFNTLVWDYSCLSEALGYEFFRDAGVPAPRTAYAWLSLSVTTQWEQKPVGLFLMEEPIDNEFAAERFGSKSAPVFKPVTYNLFEHLGDEWPAYAPIYDLKTRATPEQQRRVIDFARLVSSATDAEFTARAGDFLDLDEFARFLAGQVLLPNYDGILSAGQNFYMYLDPHSNKFGFIPWDLDGAWGNIWVASRAEQEQASIWHPWMGENRFLERVMAVEEFRRIYRSHLEDFVARLYVPDRLHRRIDEIAAVIRDPIAAQSALLLDKFEQEVGWKPVHRSPGELRDSFNRPAHELKRFIDQRAASVRRQLDGKSRGMILKYPEQK